MMVASTAPPRPPMPFRQANDDTATTTKNHAVDINVLANDIVPSGFIVSRIEIESDPQHGTATVQHRQDDSLRAR